MPIHDYSQDDFNTDPDNFTIGGDVVASDKSADEIESANSFTDVPPGEQLLVVAGFAGPPEEALYKVSLNGRMVSFSAHSVRVRFHLDGKPNCSISDFFLLPPSDPRELNAYYLGLPEGKKQAGWAASKFIHFINRLGYPFPPGAKLPEAARRLGNWKGRKIYAMVEAGRGTYTDKNGVEKPRGNQIKPFSFRIASGGAAGVGPAVKPAHVTDQHTAYTTGMSHAGPVMAGASGDELTRDQLQTRRLQPQLDAHSGLDNL